jgi:hypothetical protein
LALLPLAVQLEKINPLYPFFFHYLLSCRRRNGNLIILIKLLIKPLLNFGILVMEKILGGRDVTEQNVAALISLSSATGKRTTFLRPLVVTLFSRMRKFSGDGSNE